MPLVWRQWPPAMRSAILSLWGCSKRLIFLASREGMAEEEADSSNLKKGFGVTNSVGCQLRYVKLACLVKEVLSPKNNHTYNNLKNISARLDLIPRILQCLASFIFRA